MLPCCLSYFIPFFLLSRSCPYDADDPLDGFPGLTLVIRKIAYTLDASRHGPSVLLSSLKWNIKYIANLIIVGGVVCTQHRPRTLRSIAGAKTAYQGYTWCSSAWCAKAWCAPRRGTRRAARGENCRHPYARKSTQNVHIIRSPHPIAGTIQTGLECHANNKETSADRCAAA